LFDSRSGLEPSAFITYTSPLRVKRSRYVSKAILVPSGDQAGAPSTKPPSVVRLTAFEPSAFMTTMSRLPRRSLEYTIFVPSGDHAGSSSNPTRLVRLTGLDPSAFITNISRSPLLKSLVKATFDPSGDQAGR
jgi:hypothetical protein